MTQYMADEKKPPFRFTAAVAEFAQILRGSIWANDGSLEAVLAEAQKAVGLMDPTPRDREFIALLESANRLTGG